MSWLPEDIREASGGEVVDRAAHDAIRLAHRAVNRFPDLVRRHKYIAGGAAISSSLIVLAGVAVAQRMRRGESAEDAVNGVTEDELEGRVRLEDDAVEAPGTETMGDLSTAEDAAGALGPERREPIPLARNGTREADSDAARDAQESH